MFYIYESHLTGAAYITDEEQDYEFLYCETCGDSDRLINTFDNEEEANMFVEKYNNGEV